MIGACLTFTRPLILMPSFVKTVTDDILFREILVRLFSLRPSVHPFEAPGAALGHCGQKTRISNARVNTRHVPEYCPARNVVRKHQVFLMVLVFDILITCKDI